MCRTPASHSPKRVNFEQINTSKDDNFNKNCDNCNEEAGIILSTLNSYLFYMEDSVSK